MEHKNPIPRHAASLIFFVGVACMLVAGYFLIEGLSQFAGTATTRNILIIGGILFQITESLCFIAAASLTFHSITWRITLFTLGTILFVFSIGVMTLAQKTALQAGINEANAVDEKRAHIRGQLESLDSMINSYQYNAEKQSKSIFKDSRALGQDSINRAADIEQQKQVLSDQLFALNHERRETSEDFFKRLEEVTQLPARTTEFYFLVLRSLLIELCGILLMAFGASLRAITPLRIKPSAELVIPPPLFPIPGDILPVQTQAEIKFESPPDKPRGSGAEKSLIKPLTKPIVKSIAKPIVKAQPKAEERVSEKRPQYSPEPDFPPGFIDSSGAADSPEANDDIIIEGDLGSETGFAHSEYLHEPTEVVDDEPNVIQFKQHSFSSLINNMKKSQTKEIKTNEVAQLAKKVQELHTKGKLRSLGRDTIIRALREHYGINIGSGKAAEIKDYLEDPRQQMKDEK